MHVAALKLPGRDIDHGPAHVIGKVAILGALLGGIAGVFGWIVAGVVGGATIGAALNWWWRHVVRPVIEDIREIRANNELGNALREDPETLQAILSLADWMKGIDQMVGGTAHNAAAAKEASVATARELGVHHREPDPPGPPKL